MEVKGHSSSTDLLLCYSGKAALADVSALCADHTAVAVHVHLAVPELVDLTDLV